MSVVVGTKAFIEANHQPTILRRSVGELVPRPVVFADWNEKILVDVERCRQPLGEDVHNVVVTVRAVVEFDTKRVLPLLRLENVVSIGRVKNEAFKVKLAYAAKLRTWRETIFYLKPGEKKRVKQALARKRARKKIRRDSD